MSEAQPDQTHDQHAVRRQKLAELRAAGADPFRASFTPTHSSAQALRAHGAGQDYAVPVAVAGRLVTIRDMGKSQFVKVLDQDGQIQLYLKRDVVGEEAYAGFKRLDLGDIIGAQGTLFTTKSGEITVKVDRFVLLAKALRPLPEKWHGLSDPEQVYRQRYLDVIVNAESRARLLLRSRIVSHIRRFLEDRRFLELETPVLESTPGGAAARPFKTHHNALGADFFLRIATELRLKRMLVGGFDRVFEIGRIFRNEGVSRKHNPEFTMLEVYEAYSDFRGMMRLVRELLESLVREVVRPAEGNLRLRHAPSGQDIDFGVPWREARYKDLIREATGDADWFTRAKAEKIAGAERLGLGISPAWEEFEITNEIFSKRIEPTLIQPTLAEKIAGAERLGLGISPAWEEFEITNEIFSKRIEPTLIQPTFVTHLPRELCPLAKLSLDDPSTIDVFELIIGGMEVAPAYSEQNDPDVQREMFERQAGEERQNIDQDFLLALEHGMPPAGGMGIGIDRLCILLTGAESIRDVILFPQLRPGGG